MAETGLYKGGENRSHDSGNDIPVTVDGVKKIKVEGAEYKLCSDVMGSSEHFDFSDKTNKEILDYFHQHGYCHFDEKVADSGDFIICKKAVLDEKKRDRKGTIRTIVNAIQSEHDCKTSADSVAAKGGQIKPASEEELKARTEKKREKIKNLAENLRSLKINNTKNLSSSDEKEALTALVIALMFKSNERVGNEESASQGHIGITGIRKKNVRIKGSTIYLTYTGKSGVKHEKSFTDADLAKYLKKAIKNTPNHKVFTTSDHFKIKNDRINRVLSEHGVTSKDIRAHQANKMVIDRLKKITPEKEESKRKKQFISIAKKVAASVGHSSNMLRKSYLLPEVEQNWINHGKVSEIKDFKDGGDVSSAVFSEQKKSAKKDITKTNEFKNWFDGSKVVDEDGKPLIVYHGSADKITVFDSRYGGDTTANNQHGAFFFTDNEEVATDYSRQAFIRRNEGEYYEKNKMDDIHDDAEKQIKVIPVYLKIKNPLIIDFKGEVIDTIKSEQYINLAKNGVWEEGLYEDEIMDLKYYTQDDIDLYRTEIEERARDNYGIDEDEEISESDFNQAALDVLLENVPLSFDGVIFKNCVDDIGEHSKVIQDEYIVFESEQIKLANGKNTTFDASNPDIRYNEGGGVSSSADFFEFPYRHTTHKKTAKKDIKILYLQGYKDTTTQPLVDYMKEHFEVIAPKIDYDKVSYPEIYRLIRDSDPDILIGHSRGGAYAYYSSNGFNMPALLFNPQLDGTFDDDTRLSFAKTPVEVVLGEHDEDIDNEKVKDYVKGRAVVFEENMGHQVPLDIFEKRLNSFIDSFKNQKKFFLSQLDFKIGDKIEYKDEDFEWTITDEKEFGVHKIYKLKSLSSTFGDFFEVNGSTLTMYIEKGLAVLKSEKNPIKEEFSLGGEIDKSHAKKDYGEIIIRDYPLKKEYVFTELRYNRNFGDKPLEEYKNKIGELCSVYIYKTKSDYLADFKLRVGATTHFTGRLFRYKCSPEETKRLMEFYDKQFGDGGVIPFSADFIPEMKTYSKENRYKLIVNAGAENEEKYFWITADNVSEIANTKKNSYFDVYESNDGIELLKVSFPIKINYSNGGGIKTTEKMNNKGGYDYTDKEEQTAKKFDLLTLPKNIEGTNCSNCSFVEILDAKEGKGFCTHKDIKLPVTARMCCALWTSKGVSRSWLKEDGGVIGAPAYSTSSYLDDNVGAVYDKSTNQFTITDKKTQTELTIGNIYNKEQADLIIELLKDIPSNEWYGTMKKNEYVNYNVTNPVAVEVAIHQETFEKIQAGEINTPQDLGESLNKDHEKAEVAVSSSADFLKPKELVAPGDAYATTTLENTQATMKLGGEIKPAQIKSHIDKWQDTATSWSDLSNYKKIAFTNNLTDKGLQRIIKPFRETDDLRPNITGVNFDDNGITATNGHVLITLPYPNKKSNGLWINGKKSDLKFPKYEAVLPTKTEYSRKVNLRRLLTYVNVAEKFTNQTHHIVSFRYDGGVISFDTNLLKDVIETYLYLGYEYVYFHMSKPSHAVVITPNAKYKLGKDIIMLLMPKEPYSDNLGAEDLDFNRSLSAYFDFRDSEIHDKGGKVSKNPAKNITITPEQAKFLRSIQKLGGHQPVLDYIAVINGSAMTSDLETCATIKDTGLKDSLYEMVNGELMQYESEHGGGVDDFPKAVDTKYKAGKVSCAELLKNLEKAIEFTSNDKFKYHLQGVRFYTKDKNLRIEATNEYVAYRNTIKLEHELDFDFIVHPKHVISFLKYINDGSVAISISDKHVSFSAQDAELQTREIDSKLPDLDKHIKYDKCLDIPADLFLEKLDEIKIAEYKRKYNYTRPIYAITLEGDLKDEGVFKVYFNALSYGYGDKKEVLEKKCLGDINYSHKKESDRKEIGADYKPTPILKGLTQDSELSSDTREPDETDSDSETSDNKNKDNTKNNTTDENNDNNSQHSDIQFKKGGDLTEKNRIKDRFTLISPLKIGGFAFNYEQLHTILSVNENHLLRWFYKTVDGIFISELSHEEVIETTSELNDAYEALRILAKEDKIFAGEVKKFKEEHKL